MSPDVRVIVVPVAVHPGSPDRIQFVSYRARGDWLTGRPKSDQTPRDCAVDLCSGAAESLGLKNGSAESLQRAGFVETEDGQPEVIFTVAWPMASTLDVTSKPGEELLLSGWCDLIALDPADGNVAFSVLDHWRRALAERPAVFDLLPRFFTTAQVRSVYDAVWGEGQDAGTFQKWFHTGGNATICEKVDDAVVRAEVQNLASSIWQDTDLGHEDLSMADLTQHLVGTSPIALRVGRTVPHIRLASMVVGALVAYQADKPRGRPPGWYRAADHLPVYLRTPYGPQPLWLDRSRTTTS